MNEVCKGRKRKRGERTIEIERGERRRKWKKKGDTGIKMEERKREIEREDYSEAEKKKRRMR